MSAGTDYLRDARDRAQTVYAHTRQRVVTGQATGSELDKAREDYLLAQSEYREAMLRNKKNRGHA